MFHHIGADNDVVRFWYGIFPRNSGVVLSNLISIAESTLQQRLTASVIENIDAVRLAANVPD